MNLNLTRTESIADGTFGLLRVNAGLLLHTLEDDWRDNERSESCIPAGVYLLERTIYRKHNYETFEVTGVPDRSRILIHPGNTEEDTMGCILVGLRQGSVRVADDEDTHAAGIWKRGVVASQEAFRRFMRAMANVDEAELTIEWAEGLP